MHIGAAIYHYRHWPGVRSTIDGLLAQTRPPDHLVVLDHASGDGSADAIREAYPDVEVVETPDNRGQVAGENRARRLLLERGFEGLYVSPDDLELAPDALERLEERLEQEPALGAVGPLIGRPDDRERLFYAGGYVLAHNWAFKLRDEPPLLEDWKGAPPQTVDFLQTGGMLMRAEVARQVGELDERFWYWFEDVDYTIRVSLSGWRVECLPAAVGWQAFGAPGAYIRTRNPLMTIANNAPRRYVVREVLRQLTLLGRDALEPGRPRDDLGPRWQGLRDFCLRRYGPPPPDLSDKRHAATS